MMSRLQPSCSQAVKHGVGSASVSHGSTSLGLMVTASGSYSQPASSSQDAWSLPSSSLSLVPVLTRKQSPVDVSRSTATASNVNLSSILPSLFNYSDGGAKPLTPTHQPPASKSR